LEGLSERVLEGFGVGENVGYLEGIGVGPPVGTLDGREDGLTLSMVLVGDGVTSQRDGSHCGPQILGNSPAAI